jgi:hypothetical protein
MELLFGIVWEIPRIYGECLCFSEGDLEVAMSASKCPDWNTNGDVLECPAEPGEWLWHQAVTQKVTSFFHSVHKKSVIPFIIIHLHIFFVVMMAFSVLF